MKLVIWFNAIFLVCICNVSAQDALLNPNSMDYNELDRLQIKSGRLDHIMHLDIRDVREMDAMKFLDNLDSAHMNITKADKYWIKYLRDDNLPYSHSTDSSKYPVLKTFYKTPANLFEVNLPEFHLYLNPVLGLSLGKEKDSSKYRYMNTRGIEVRGDIDGKIGFYSYFSDNQDIFASYIEHYIKKSGQVPGQGYWKPYENQIPDYFDASGYFTFSATPHIQFQLGNGNNFIGDGFRSLLLSDFAANYLYLKISLQVWRLKYDCFYAQLTDVSNVPLYHFDQKKYAAFHYLSTDVTKWLNIGFFEAVVMDDSIPNRGFDAAYINPIIFYTYIEQMQGNVSPDKDLVGMNVNMIAAKRFRIYSQVVINEFQAHQIISGSNWWGNKYAGQLGFKYVDVFGLPNVDWQEEGNYIRPYTYSGLRSELAYNQWNQPLADPMGANLEELVSLLRINCFGPLQINLKYILTVQGQDTGKIDYGSNISIPYSKEVDSKGVRDLYNVLELQGVRTTIKFAEATVSYQLRHNLYIDLDAIMRSETSIVQNYKMSYVGLGLRLNFAMPNYSF